MEKRKKKTEIPETKARLTGIAGIGKSVGCTHFTIMYANYLAGFCRKKTAVIEWNNSGDFERIEKVCTGRVEEYRPCHILEADYYKNAGEKDMGLILDENYEEILIDFGPLDDMSGNEFRRCEKKFMVVSFSEWQQEIIRESVCEKYRAEKKGWQFVASFGSEETRKEFERRFGISAKRIPFSADAFSVTTECGSFFQALA